MHYEYAIVVYNETDILWSIVYANTVIAFKQAC